MMNSESYRLWWEYLKRSKPYKVLCSIADRKKIFKEHIPFPTQDKIFNYFTGKIKIDFEAKYNVNVATLVDIYSFWGDVHQNDFKCWWNNRGKEAIMKSKSAVTDIKKDMGILSHIATMFINYSLQNRKKTAYGFDDIVDVITNLRGYLSSPFNQQYLFLKIDIHSKATSDEISREIAKLRNKQRATDRPSGLRLHNELNKYLTVYDKKEIDNKRKWHEIISEIGTPAEKGKNKDADTLREYRRYYRKAKNIICNVENNKFPGKY